MPCCCRKGSKSDLAPVLQLASETAGTVRSAMPMSRPPLVLAWRRAGLRPAFRALLALLSEEPFCWPCQLLRRLDASSR